jgi:YVTN family beta-propeller protein
VAAAVGLLATAASAAAGTAGEIGPSLSMTANGRLLNPVGTQTTLGNFPTGAALTPDGKYLWAVDSGNGSDDVRILNVATNQVVQTLPLPGAYGGVAFAPDGTHAYVSGTARGTSPTEGPTQGDGGDVVHVFSINTSTGQATEQAPISLPQTLGGSGRMNSLPPVTAAWPDGLAVSPDGSKLVVALNQADRAAVINLQTGAATTVSVGAYPAGVAFDPQGRAYVSNEYDGTISVLDVGAGTVTATIAGLGGPAGDKGSHPEGMVADPRRPALYVAVTNRDLVAVVDTNAKTVTRTVSVARPDGIGAAPVSLAISPDGGTLYSADANEDAVAGIALTNRDDGSDESENDGQSEPVGDNDVNDNESQPSNDLDDGGAPAFSVIGKLSTAAYPSAVAVTPDGQKLAWVAAKGYGAGPNPGFVFDGPTPYGTYVLDMLSGRAGVLARPTDAQLQADTAAADSEVHPANAQSPPTGTPVVGPGGGPSAQIKHVFYIVRENRTYDQIFGTDPRGDGQASLELFDDNGVSGPTGGITPNAHALARTFPLLDHVYADSEVSIDGHLITAGAYATDYVQRATPANYSGRGRAFDFGIFPVTFPPNDFVFDQAVRQSVSFRNYGEQAAGVSPTGNDGRPTYAQVVAGTDATYPGNLQIGCSVTGGGGPVVPVASCTQDSGVLGTSGTKTAGTSRFDLFSAQFRAQVAAGAVPALNYLILPNDHTNGTTPGAYTPQALIADNDLALGQVVDLISHSSIWPQTAIFVVEDDSQDGADHVDAHRMPGFVISPWAKRGGVNVGTRYDQYSVLRTIELILGLRPLSLNDALATPTYDAFDTTSDPAGTIYTAIKPTQSLTQMNTGASAAARTSARLPFSVPDQVPQAVSDAILWQSVHGAGSTPPPPGPNASPSEHARAVAVGRALAHGRDLRRLPGNRDGG